VTTPTQKPYLIRAIHEWCSDQGFTPYLAVEVDAHTRVPQGFVRDGVIVLNVGHEATHQLTIGNEDVTFQARFGGRAFPIRVPIERVQAIYARENGQGMAFEVTEVSVSASPVVVDSGQLEAAEAPPDSVPHSAPETESRHPDSPSGRPSLKRIK
jgi:stringent starvation protein B